MTVVLVTDVFPSAEFGGGGGGTWGSITGTLSNQTDLQTALNARQPLDTQLTSVAGLSYTGNSLKVMRVNVGETDFELATITSGPSAAVPTGTIGLTAVNGSAATFLRSDGAPALSQAIAPTWTAVHTFSQDIGATSTDGIVLSNPTAATLNNQKWPPRLRFRGSVWETTGGTSQTYDWVQEGQTIQSAAPISNLVWKSSVNGAAYVDRMWLDGQDGGGRLYIKGQTGAAAGAGLNFYSNGVANSASIGLDGSSNMVFRLSTSGGMYFDYQATLYFRSGSGNIRLFLDNAGNTRFGDTAANPPIAQTLSVQDASGTDIAGAAWTFRGSRGTSAGASGGFAWSTGDVASTGTTLQTATVKMTLTGTGKLFVGGTTTPTARLHLAAGTTTAATGPLKFTAGPLMTSVEEGAMEFKGHTLYMTTFQVRRSVVLAQEVPIARVAVPASSTTKTLVYSVPMAATYLTAGKKINTRLNGTITQRNAAASFYTITLEYAGSAVLTFTTPISTAMAAVPFEIDLRTVCRSIGATGKLISFGKFTYSGTASTSIMGAETTVDTTAANTLEVYITANENNAGTGPVNIEMGETICVDANT